ncbi:MAG: hypothetical protein HRU77_01510 [Gammaproteobacteria bacterium]|nr:MAG: hypothetical protein HRU77_01510 [Gammaproteobacteria bacterium]
MSEKSRKKQIIAVTAAVVINVLLRQERLLRKIAMNQQELLDKLNDANAKSEKIVSEIRMLKTAVENADNVSPQIAEAANRLIGNLDVADAEIPDEAPAPAPEPAPAAEFTPAPEPAPETAPA